MTEKKGNSTVKWVCGTILIIFLVTWATVVIVPLGFMATISNFFEKSKNIEKVIVKKVYVPRSNQKTKTPPAIKYSYIVLLKNGKRIDAKSIKKSQGIVHLENNSGLIMKISSSEIDSIKKCKI